MPLGWRQLIGVSSGGRGQAPPLRTAYRIHPYELHGIRPDRSLAGTERQDAGVLWRLAAETLEEETTWETARTVARSWRSL